MARPSDIHNRRLNQLLQISGDSTYVRNILRESVATGELVLQVTDSASGTSLWALAKDGITPIQFINKREVEAMIIGGSGSTEIQNIKDAVGLDDEGNYIPKSGSNFLDSATTIEEEISALDDGVGRASDFALALKISAVTPSSANIREEYALMSFDGIPIGDTVKIYKDSSLYRVYLGHVDDELVSPTDPTVISGSGDAALCFIYEKDNGTYELVAINLSGLITESIYEDGLTVNGNVVKVKIDESSENFLTVGPNGVKLAGVQNAINAEAERATAAEQALSGSIETISSSTKVETSRAISAETQIDSAIGLIKDAQSEERIYAHTDTNYLNSNSTVKSDAETLDAIIGKDSATTFSSENTIAKNITDIKKSIEDFKNKLSLSGAENPYTKVVVTSAETGTTIEVSAKTQDISTATATEQGLADAYDVRTFSVKGVNATDVSTSAGVKVETVGGDKVLDFSELKVDCGEF